MALFSQWFVGELMGIELDQGEKNLLNSLFDELTRSALAQPQVVVHRDYHSRNLMLLEDKTLGVIDFQDAVYGPITYDLVSLLRDCYVRWPADSMRSRALAYKVLTCNHISDQQFLTWFDLMGLQRHIKVMGIFSRLALRDGKQGYLHDLPLVIRYSLEVAKDYPQSRAFYDWFLQRVEPQLSNQPWYRDWHTAGDNL
jgi:aminoglycoside/choline kinase family phosphotransferase